MLLNQREGNDYCFGPRLYLITGADDARQKSDTENSHREEEEGEDDAMLLFVPYYQEDT